jgi:hypothetical protein
VDPHDRILAFPDRNRYCFFQVSPQLNSRASLSICLDWEKRRQVIRYSRREASNTRFVREILSLERDVFRLPLGPLTVTGHRLQPVRHARQVGPL